LRRADGPLSFANGDGGSRPDDDGDDDDDCPVGFCRLPFRVSVDGSGALRTGHNCVLLLDFEGSFLSFPRNGSKIELSFLDTSSNKSISCFVRLSAMIDLISG